MIIDHDAITKIVAPNGYGVGVYPNPFLEQEPEYMRRKQMAELRAKLTRKIEMLFEPRFITVPPTAEFIESLITMTDSRRILEVGMCTGYTTLHMLRAVVGKAGAKVVSVDARPAHDKAFFDEPDIAPYFQFVGGWTPDCLWSLRGGAFEVVFVDSDHTAAHTEKELQVLKHITTKDCIFLFHDVPAWRSNEDRTPVPVRGWLLENTELRGLALPSSEQLDCRMTFGNGYDKRLNPGLGIFTPKR